MIDPKAKLQTHTSLETRTPLQTHTNEQALAVVRRVQKVFVPTRLRGRERTVTVPVGFYLQDT